MSAGKRKKTGSKASFMVVMITGIILLAFLVIWLIGELKNISGGGSAQGSDQAKSTTSGSSSEIRDVLSVVDGYIDRLLAEKNITIAANGESVTVNAGQAGAPVNYSELETCLRENGEDTALIGQYRTILTAQNRPEYILDNKYIAACIDKLANMVDKGVDTTYEITADGVKIVRGSTHEVIFADELSNQITQALLSYDYADIIARTELEPTVNPDADEIRAAVYQPAENARYDTENFEGSIPNEGNVGQRTVVVAEKYGRDIDVEAIRNGLANEVWSEKTYPFISLEPEIKEAQVGEGYFKDLLGSYTTKYSTSNAGRTTNILIASQAVNGVVILPGNKFSFNDIVGERTKEKGYQPALIYTIDGMEPDYGGGICQLVSTVYAASLTSGLKQTARYNHGYTVSYIKLGIDATVAWPYTDYRFRNDTSDPIKVLVTNKNGTLTVEIYGTKNGGERRVEFKTNKLEDLIPEMTEIADATLAPGKKVIPKFTYGYVIETYMLTYIDNQLVSEVKLHTDTYNPYPKKIEVRVGPAVTQPPAETTGDYTSD